MWLSVNKETRLGKKKLLTLTKTYFCLDLITFYTQSKKNFHVNEIMLSLPNDEVCDNAKHRIPLHNAYTLSLAERSRASFRSSDLKTPHVPWSCHLLLTNIKTCCREDSVASLRLLLYLGFVRKVSLSPFKTIVFGKPLSWENFVYHITVQTWMKVILAVMCTTEAVVKIRPEKIQACRIWTHDLCDTGAALYQLS